MSEQKQNLVPQTEGWHVFYVKSRHEKRVYAELIDQGYNAYLPLKKRLKQWKDRKKVIEEPLFKSYIFVYIKPHKIDKILEIMSVVTYISFGGRPALVRHEHIKLIRKLIRTKAEFDVTNFAYKVGDTIKIEHGPFKGYRGRIKELRSAKKLVVSLNEIEFSLVVDYSEDD